MSTAFIRRARRAAAVALASGAIFALAACSSDSGDAADSGTDDAASGSIVLVHDQAAGDGSVIDSQIAGITEIADEYGWEENNVFVDDAANYESTLRNVADTAPDVIVTSFYRITDAFNAVAADYPDIKFVHVYADEEDPTIPNLLTVSYDSYKVNYVSGVMAASFSSTGKIGMVLGDTQPLIAADYNAFVAGAEAAVPGIEVVNGVVGNYDDSATAQTVAEQLYASGVDVIQTDAGGADAGTIAAAKDGADRYLVASSLSVLDEAPEQTLAVGGLDFGASVVEAVHMAMEDGFAGGHLATGVGEALSLTIADASPTDAVSDRFDAAKAATESAATEVGDGTVEVPFVTDMP